MRQRTLKAQPPNDNVRVLSSNTSVTSRKLISPSSDSSPASSGRVLLASDANKSCLRLWEVSVPGVGNLYGKRRLINLSMTGNKVSGELGGLVVCGNDNPLWFSEPFVANDVVEVEFFPRETLPR
jgi:hypothetical protein